MSDARVRAYLGLGGNIGDPVANMAAALRAIDARPDIDVAAVSRLFRTPPWGNTDQPWFVNACAAVDTTLSARALLDLCLDTERSLKRERTLRWGPRTIDLDVLDYGSRTVAEEGLDLPHPRMTQRAFVMVPLAEIAPDLVLEGHRAAEIAVALDAAGIEPASADGQWWRAG
ncbi:2-amino-4-hydroxy-6-hydroxymethyldihydropteridine diphosphokinase [Antarcticirhabdus aurantiaca]|nr:2-amino-4-hydroxy-6-hydroxymethyldihydropteridine diphosphokinase [Antarcticirhabdus aurantiaca]